MPSYLELMSQESPNKIIYIFFVCSTKVVSLSCVHPSPVLYVSCVCSTKEFPVSLIFTDQVFLTFCDCPPMYYLYSLFFSNKLEDQLYPPKPPPTGESSGDQWE